jgi:hypothetical protein
MPSGNLRFAIYDLRGFGMVTVHCVGRCWGEALCVLRISYCVSGHGTAGRFGDSLTPFPFFPILYVKEPQVIKHSSMALANLDAILIKGAENNI